MSRSSVRTYYNERKTHDKEELLTNLEMRKNLALEIQSPLADETTNEMCDVLKKNANAIQLLSIERVFRLEILKRSAELFTLMMQQNSLDSLTLLDNNISEIPGGLKNIRAWLRNSREKKYFRLHDRCQDKKLAQLFVDQGTKNFPGLKLKELLLKADVGKATMKALTASLSTVESEVETLRLDTELTQENFKVFCDNLPNLTIKTLALSLDERITSTEEGKEKFSPGKSLADAMNRNRTVRNICLDALKQSSFLNFLEGLSVRENLRHVSLNCYGEIDTPLLIRLTKTVEANRSLCKVTCAGAKASPDLVVKVKKNILGKIKDFLKHPNSNPENNNREEPWSRLKEALESGHVQKVFRKKYVMLGDKLRTEEVKEDNAQIRGRSDIDVKAVTSSRKPDKQSLQTIGLDFEDIDSFQILKKSLDAPEQTVKKRATFNDAAIEEFLDNLYDPNDNAEMNEFFSQGYLLSRISNFSETLSYEPHVYDRSSECIIVIDVDKIFENKKKAERRILKWVHCAMKDGQDKINFLFVNGDALTLNMDETTADYIKMLKKNLTKMMSEVSGVNIPAPQFYSVEDLDDMKLQLENSKDAVHSEIKLSWVACFLKLKKQFPLLCLDDDILAVLKEHKLESDVETFKASFLEIGEILRLDEGTYVFDISNFREVVANLFATSTARNMAHKIGLYHWEEIIMKLSTIPPRLDIQDAFLKWLKQNFLMFPVASKDKQERYLMLGTTLQEKSGFAAKLEEMKYFFYINFSSEIHIPLCFRGITAFILQEIMPTGFDEVLVSQLFGNAFRFSFDDSFSWMYVDKSLSRIYFGFDEKEVNLEQLESLLAFFSNALTYCHETYKCSPKIIIPSPTPGGEREYTVFDKSRDFLSKQYLVNRQPRTSPRRYSVFLSHAWGKKSFNHHRAEKLAEDLEAKGISVWFDSENMKTNLPESMKKGIDISNVFLVILEDNYIQKMTAKEKNNCKLEHDYAKAQKKKCIYLTMTEEEHDKAIGSPKLASFRGENLILCHDIEDEYNKMLKLIFEENNK